MTIPPEINTLVAQINSELDQIEQQSILGIERVRTLLDRFPNNDFLIRDFALFNNAIFLVSSFRRQIQANLDEISNEEIPDSILQEIGEYLSTLQGRAIEAKIQVEASVARLERLL